jgi:hypothetical protein
VSGGDAGTAEEGVGTRAAVGLVRRLARPRPSAADRAVAAALAREADPDAVVHAAAALGVGPLVAGHLDDDAFPPGLRERVAAARRTMATRSLHLVAVLHRVLATFEAAGVPVLAYKGPVLAKVAYGDVGGRAFSDLDLFARRADVAAAADALADLGFALDTETAFSPADVVRGGHVVRPPAEFRFVHPDGGAVELRWRLGSRVRPFPLRFEDCWRRRTTVIVGGRPVRTFDPADRLLVLARHGAKHHWNRLGWVVDVAALLERVRVDWDVVADRAAALGGRRVLATCALLAADVADAPVPAAVLDAARADGAARRTAAEAAADFDASPLTAAFGVDPRRERAVDVRLCDTGRARLGVLARLAFEPQEVDARSLPLPRTLHRLYHLVRPVRLARDGVAGFVPGTRPRAGGPPP